MRAERVNGAVLWANMHLLFWLSHLRLALLMPAVAYYCCRPTSGCMAARTGSLEGQDLSERSG